MSITREALQVEAARHAGLRDQLLAQAAQLAEQRGRVIAQANGAEGARQAVEALLATCEAAAVIPVETAANGKGGKAANLKPAEAVH